MNRFLLFTCFFIVSLCASAQYSTLERQIQSIIRGNNATVGVAVLFDGKDLITVNDQYEYPMQSVFKLHQAMAILDYLNQNNLSLNTEITIKKDDLRPDTHSPLRDKYLHGDNFTIPVRELIRYSVAESDNNACDILFSYIGGPNAVHTYIKGIGIEKFAITCNEETMHTNPDAQYNNWTTPSEAVKLIELFRNKDLLTAEHRAFLEKTLIETKTGTDKIKGFLPEDIIVGHKTGTSFRNATGMKGADNDIGFIVLPDNSGYSLAIFIKDSMESDKKNAEIIARISRIVFENYIQKDMY